MSVNNNILLSKELKYLNNTNAKSNYTKSIIRV